MNKFIKLLILVFFVFLFLIGQAQATFIFGTPDTPGPVTPGLKGSIWTNVDVDTLADARAYIGANCPDAEFVSSMVDYPNGPATVVDMNIPTTFNDVLGTDAWTLSDPTVGSSPPLNSIMQFTGYLFYDGGFPPPGIPFFLGVGSDDGSELLIQGTQVQNNDGIHPFPGNSPLDYVAFLAPGFYELEILFFESQMSHWGIEFYIDVPGAFTETVPDFMLYHPISEPVPEPATMLLLGTGLIGLAGIGRKKFFKKN